MIFSLKRGSAYLDILENTPLLSVDSSFIARPLTIKYLGLTMSSNLSWSFHVQNVFSKVRKLSFFTLKLRKLSFPSIVIFKFTTLCILPLWLYCSPVFFPGLKDKDFILLTRSLKMLSRCSGLPRSEIVSFLVNKHISACDSLASRALKNPSHVLHAAISKAISLSSSRSNYRLIFARTNAFRNSTIPYLARLLYNRSHVINELSERLSR